MSKDPKPIPHPHIFWGSKGRETVILKNYVPELMEVKILVAGKVIFPRPGLDPMFITNRTAVGFTLNTTTTTSLFEKLYIHMFSFLNNSIAIWCVKLQPALDFFLSVKRKILHNLKLRSCWKQGLSDQILIVDSILLMSFRKVYFFCVAPSRLFH